MRPEMCSRGVGAIVESMANDSSGLQLGVFDHIEHLPGVSLDIEHETFRFYRLV